MQVQKWAAFSDGSAGGNPAGIVLADAFPTEAEMRKLAAELGFSETAFAVPTGSRWRVRYFSPESEVPFCGHATIALGAALATAHGDGRFDLTLNHGEITVDGQRTGALFSAALQSPPTRSRPLEPALLAEVLQVFGYRPEQLDPRISPAWIHGGADHVALCLRSRAELSALHYDLDRGRTLMNREGWVTVLFAVIDTPQRFHTRNAFASGGVYEDPATGAATAAFAGYLRDLRWPHQGLIDIVQGEDMGMRSLLRAEIPAAAGSSIRVSGTARQL